MDGADEEKCDEVELNDCEQNEFRCQNGLCIPEEYWVDGKLRIFMKSTYQTDITVTTGFYDVFVYSKSEYTLESVSMSGRPFTR